MVVRNVYFVRHGETDDNKAGIMQGCLRDTLLNDKGREQAAALQRANKLPAKYETYSSPMKRALETCQIATLRDHDDIILDERLVERNFGQWTGKLKSECLARLATLGIDISEMGVSVDEIETWPAFSQRVGSALTDLIKGEAVTKVVFCHGGVIQAMTEIILPKLESDSTDKQSLLAPAGNCSVYKLVVDVKPEYISYIDFKNV